jgi:hypothetical protein
MQIYSNTTADRSQPLSVAILSFRAFEKNTLKGFVSLQIDPPGIVLHDLTYHEKSDSRWFCFPAKRPQNETDKWFPLVEIPDRGVLKAFQAAALEAIDRYIAVGGGS